MRRSCGSLWPRWAGGHFRLCDWRVSGPDLWSGGAVATALSGPSPGTDRSASDGDADRHAHVLLVNTTEAGADRADAAGTGGAYLTGGRRGANGGNAVRSHRPGGRNGWRGAPLGAAPAAVANGSRKPTAGKRDAGLSRAGALARLRGAGAG